MSADILVSHLTGMRIYSSENNVDQRTMAEIDGDWDDIGEQTLAVNMDELTFVAEKNDPGEYFIVVKASREMLEKAKPFDFDLVGAWTNAKWNAAKATAASAAESVKKTAPDASEYTKTAAAEVGNEFRHTASSWTAPVGSLQD